MPLPFVLAYSRSSDTFSTESLSCGLVTKGLTRGSGSFTQMASLEMHLRFSLPARSAKATGLVSRLLSLAQHGRRLDIISSSRSTFSLVKSNNPCSFAKDASVCSLIVCIRRSCPLFPLGSGLVVILFGFGEMYQEYTFTQSMLILPSFTLQICCSWTNRKFVLISRLSMIRQILFLFKPNRSVLSQNERFGPEWIRDSLIGPPEFSRSRSSLIVRKAQLLLRLHDGALKPLESLYVVPVKQDCGVEVAAPLRSAGVDEAAEAPSDKLGARDTSTVQRLLVNRDLIANWFLFWSLYLAGLFCSCMILP